MAAADVEEPCSVSRSRSTSVVGLAAGWQPAALRSITSKATKTIRNEGVFFETGCLTRVAIVPLASCRRRRHCRGRRGVDRSFPVHYTFIFLLVQDVEEWVIEWTTRVATMPIQWMAGSAIAGLCAYGPTLLSRIHEHVPCLRCRLGNHKQALLGHVPVAPSCYGTVRVPCSHDITVLRQGHLPKGCRWIYCWQELHVPKSYR